MAPREANNPFPDEYLTIEYDATAVMMPPDTGVEDNDGETVGDGNIEMEEPPIVPPVAPLLLGTAQNDVQDNDVGANAGVNINGQIMMPLNVGNNNDAALAQPPIEVHLPSPPPIQGANVGGTHNTVTPLTHRRNNPRPRPNAPRIISVWSDLNHGDVDPLAIDMTDPEEDEAWNRVNALYVDAAMASASDRNIIFNPSNSPRARTVPTTPQPTRQVSSDGNNSNAETHRRRRTVNTVDVLSRGALVTPIPGDLLGSGNLFGHTTNNQNRLLNQRRESLLSVLDQDPSMESCSDEEDNNDVGIPELDTTNDNSTTTESTPGTPQAYSSSEDNQHVFIGAQSNGNVVEVSNINTHATTHHTGILNLSPVRRLLSENGIFNSRPQQSGHANVVSDEDTSSASSFSAPGNASPLQGIHESSNIMLPSIPSSPLRLSSGAGTPSSRNNRSNSFASSSSGHSIHWTTAFDTGNVENLSDTPGQSNMPLTPENQNVAQSPNQINLSFGPKTNVSDLKYFAERGCIVQLLRALNSPRLKTLGTRMLADYAKMPNRRVAVASNKRILEFCCRTMLELPSSDEMGTEWPAREYAVETIRSLTATEDSDGYLMGCVGLLKALAIVVRGGPFHNVPESPTKTECSELYKCQTTANMGLVSGKARLHACIAIMNLSCGKANKIEIASIPEVLKAMRDVMVSLPEHFSPATSSPPVANGNNATPKSVSEEARLKAATCIKNLSNADANDAALLGANGLVEALARVAVNTCTEEKGATHCTTNACLALMNLSISKSNKHRVFKTDGVMDALMTVLDRTSPGENSRQRGNSNIEARVKACSALSNLAIGYENKIPMFAYPGFVDAILQVIESDSGEARTKACSILWSFAAEMKNQVPVVQRGDILPTLVRVAEEDHSTEARFKCVAALTLLAESLDNALPLLESGALHPLMDILHEAGADPTQWKGQTASWCVGFLMNMAQSDDAAPFLREAGVVELLAPLLTLDHYQSLKAAMAVTFICRFDEDDETYDLLRRTEKVIPKIISLLHNTLSGRGGNGYKYGVFTLRSSVGCISSLASGPEFMKERISTKPVFDSLLRVVSDFCVNGGTKAAIVGGGRDDSLSATLAVRALFSLVEYMIPIPGSSALPFGTNMDKKLMEALDSFGVCNHPEIKEETRDLAKDASSRIQRSLGIDPSAEDGNDSGSEGFSPRRNVAHNIIENSIVASLVQGCCIGPSLHTGDDYGFFPSMIRPTSQSTPTEISDTSDGNESTSSSSTSQEAVRTFLLTDSRTGRRFAVPTDPSGGRAFNDGRSWCYRRGRFCRRGESPDPNFVWTDELDTSYSAALQSQQSSSTSQASSRASQQATTNSV